MLRNTAIMMKWYGFVCSLPQCMDERYTYTCMYGCTCNRNKYIPEDAKMGMTSMPLQLLSGH